MRKIIQNIMLNIASSVSSDTSISSTRVQSYLMMLPIFLMVIIFIIIEITAFIHALYNNTEYHISNEIIIIFMANLSHHLAILFSRSKSQGLAELTGTAVTESTSTETTSTEVVTKEKTKTPIVTPVVNVDTPKEDIPDEDPEKA